jgi:hypothetical protein
MNIKYTNVSPIFAKFILVTIGVLLVWKCIHALKIGRFSMAGRGNDIDLSKTACFSFFLAYYSVFSFILIGMSLFPSQASSDFQIGNLIFIDSAAFAARVLFFFFNVYLVTYVAVNMRQKPNGYHPPRKR